jgi:hypothetical protein
MQNAGRGIWRKFSGLSRERRDGWSPYKPVISFEALAAVKILNLVFWIVTPCGITGRRKHFGGTYCLHLLSDLVREEGFEFWIRGQDSQQVHRNSIWVPRKYKSTALLLHYLLWWEELYVTVISHILVPFFLFNQKQPRVWNSNIRVQWAGSIVSSTDGQKFYSPNFSSIRETDVNYC